MFFFVFKERRTVRGGEGGVVRVFPRGRVLREIRRYDGMIEFLVFLGVGGVVVGGGVRSGGVVVGGGWVGSVLREIKVVYPCPALLS